MNTPISAYVEFDRKAWCRFRNDTPLTLNEHDLENLQGVNEIVSLKEVEEIYLPLSRLLSLYVEGTQQLHQVSGEFLGTPEPKVPYIIGIAGSVAVGKSTSSRVLQALLSRWPNHRRVEIINTDGFLYPNSILTERGLMQRKGFPESYDLQKLLALLYDIKSGKEHLKAPIYSHHQYDILKDQFVDINKPDIVIVEGLNILQTGSAKPGKNEKIFVSDFFDFTLFVDADVEIIQQWFVERVLAFYHSEFQDAKSYFHHLTKMSEAEVKAFALKVWREINEVNLLENILPFRERARLILKKGSDHRIEKVFLRKL